MLPSVTSYSAEPDRRWQRAIDGELVWIGPALVTANFCGTCCPRPTIRSSVLSHLWKVRNEQRNGLESKTSSPINISHSQRRFIPFLPSLSLCVRLSLPLLWFPRYNFMFLTVKLWRGSSTHAAASAPISHTWNKPRSREQDWQPAQSPAISCTQMLCFDFSDFLYLWENSFAAAWELALATGSLDWDSWGLFCGWSKRLTSQWL